MQLDRSVGVSVPAKYEAEKYQSSQQAERGVPGDDFPSQQVETTCQESEIHPLPAGSNLAPNVAMPRTSS